MPISKYLGDLRAKIGHDLVLTPGVTAVVMNERGEVLLHQSSDNGKWYLIGGGMDPGEQPADAIVREVREETGLVVRAEALRLAHVVHGAWGVESPNGFLTVVFVAHEWEGEPENREPGKHTRVCWTPLDDLPADFVPSIGVPLRAYLAGGPPALTQRGWD